MIRKAKANEAAAVLNVVQAAYIRYVAVIGTPPGPMLDDYPARIAAGQVWVMEVEAGIAGVLVLQAGPDYVLLDNIAVHPDRQGQGLGRLLLEFSEAEATRCGWSTITLYTNALMVENLAIYAARGYVEQDRRTEKGFDRVYMAKRLTAN
ncbi:MAG: GNAT family N-acetyltransferase [Pseudomonadota bacterium]|nr:GNAT family N-acetyltransferase [Pseudomonadota bacterium]